MKLTNNQLQNSTIALSKLSQKELPIKISFLLAKNISHINAELKIYNDERQKLVEKYSIKDKNDKPIIENNQIKLQPKLINDWNKDMSELLSIENEVNIKQFSIDNLEGISISASEIMAIKFMIEE